MYVSLLINQSGVIKENLAMAGENLRERSRICVMGEGEREREKHVSDNWYRSVLLVPLPNYSAIKSS